MKVLLISHNPIGTQFNMGKTFMSLFSSFDKAEICQLYIYPTLPEIDLCSSFFRITDKDVLKSYYKFKVKSCEVYTDESSHNMYENMEDEKLYRNPKNKNDTRMILRDLMWRFAPWYNKSLNKWIEKEMPTCIFVAPGSATFLYNIALKISKKRNIPIITYVCDDYYFVKPAKTLLGKIRIRALKRKIQELMKNTSKLIVICDALEREYSREFSVPTSKIMTGSVFLPDCRTTINHTPQAISYFGNIRCNRNVSLANVGRVLDRINVEKGTDFKLNIYTAEKDRAIIKSFSGIKSVRLCPFVAGDEFKEKIINSDLLLHVEAFDEVSIDKVKYSISTKIADSLSCGIPLLAYAPSVVSSMEHLLLNQCAITAECEDEIEDMLICAFFDKELKESVVSKALQTAETYHTNNKNSDLLKQIISNTRR